MKIKIIWPHTDLTLVLNENHFTEKWFNLMLEHEYRAGGTHWSSHYREATISGFEDNTKIYHLNNLKKIMRLLLEHNNTLIPQEYDVYNNERDYNKQDLNNLHKIYENMASTSKWLTQGNLSLDVIKSTRDNFNNCIHNYEDFTEEHINISLKYPKLSRIRFRYVHPRTHVPNAEKIDFELDDYQYFSPLLLKDRVYLNYNQVGKDIVKQYKQNGKYEEAIPLQKYSPSFFIMLGEHPIRHQINNFYNIINWVIENGDDPSDPTLALGNLELGFVEYKEDKHSFMKKVSEGQEVIKLEFKR